MKEINIFGRHGPRSDGMGGTGRDLEGEKTSEVYPFLTEKGVEKVRETAEKYYREVIEKMDSDGVLFLGGSSEEPRTKSTVEIIGASLKELYKDREDVLVLDLEDMTNLFQGGGFLEKISRINSLINDNPGKKIVIDFPLFIKELSLRPAFRKMGTGERTEYTDKLLEEENFDPQRAVLRWLSGEGKLGNLDSINPQLAAEKGKQGIDRLRKFARAIAGGRQINIGVVGHGWLLDVLAIFYANGGKVNREAFKKLFDDKSMDQAEAGYVEIDDGEKLVLHYKGEEFETVLEK